MMQHQKPSDRSLILLYLNGDTSVLQVLVKRYHQVFCRKAYWIVKDRELAKDIAQESWLVIIKKLPELQNIDSFRGWAQRIVYNNAIDKIKLKNKESQQLMNIPCDTEVEESGDQKKTKLIALAKAIRQLPKEKQDIVRLYYSEEYSILEISNFLNIPKGTVKSRLYKAREKLKSLLKNQS